MADETPKPKRKRWRWIIAGVLLFAVAVAGWWNWLRVDKRIVGKWQCGGQVIHFRSDGLVGGFVQFDEQRRRQRVDGLRRFKAIGNRLQILPDRATGWQCVVNDLRRLWRSQELIYEGEIVSLTGSELTIRGTGSSSMRTITCRLIE